MTPNLTNMLRTLVLASLLWAMAIPVRGETFANPPGYRCGPPDRTGVRLCEEVPDPCLAKMEAAMKAMEFWSVLNFENTEQVNLNIVKPFPHDNYWAVLPDEEEWSKGSTAYGLTQTLNARAGRAIVLWDQAKRDCWKERQ
jgi:hypothetical protein